MSRPTEPDFEELTEEEEVGVKLGRGARWILAVFSFLFAAIMFLHAEVAEFPLFSHFFGVFCGGIGLACLTKGRIRQFLGSFVGLTVSLAGVLYLYSQVTGGPLISGAKSEPSVLNAILFLAAFGIPGLLYAMYARFAFRADDA